MGNFALTYRAQGRTGDAARIHEEVLEKRRRILGGRPSRHTDDHGQPRGDVWGSGEDGGRRQDSRGGAGEEEADPGGPPEITTLRLHTKVAVMNPAATN